MLKKHFIKYLSFVFLPFILITPVIIFVSYNTTFDNFSKHNITKDDLDKYIDKFKERITLSKKIKELEEELKKLKNNIHTVLEKIVSLNLKIKELQSKITQLEIELKKFEDENKDLKKEISDYKILTKFSLKLTTEKLQTNKKNVLASVEYNDKLNKTIKNLSDLGVNNLVEPKEIKVEYKMIDYSDKNGTLTLRAILNTGKTKHEVIFIIENFKSNQTLFKKYLTEIKKYINQPFDVEKKLHSHDTWLDFLKLIIKKSGTFTDKDLNSDVFKQIVLYDNQKNDIGQQVITSQYTQDNEGNSLGEKKLQKSFVLSYKGLEEKVLISFKNFKNDIKVLQEKAKELQDEYKLTAQKQITSANFKQKTPEEVINSLIDAIGLPINDSNVPTSLAFFESLIGKKISLPKGMTITIIAVLSPGENYLEFRMHLFKNHFAWGYPVQAYLYGFKSNK